MKFSLITSTIGRMEELNNLLASLDVQTCRSFELIVVDQNSRDLLQPILERYQDSFPIVHVRSARGASRGRNVGMAHARGDIIAFPDDDCTLPPDVLERVATELDAHPHWHGLSGSAADSPRWPKSAGRINRLNVWKRAIEWTIFLRREVVDHVGPMNENLGPGAGTPWGAGEGTEYLIRALGMGYRLWYEPSIAVLHCPGEDDFEKHLEKSRRYAMGQGRVLRLGHYSSWFAVYCWMRPLAGAFLGMLRRDPQRTVVAFAVVQGIIAGWSSGIRARPRTSWLRRPERISV